VARFRAVAPDREALIARGDELHRPSHAPRGDRNESGTRSDRALGTECAAHEGAHHTHASALDAELQRYTVLEAMHKLARLVDGEPGPVPDARGGEELDCVVMLGRGRVANIDRDLGLANGLLSAANLGIFVIFRGNFGRHDGRAGSVESGSGRLGLIGDVHAVCRLPGSLEAVGDDHRHDLPVVPDLGTG
jgi:hypothetical protein